MNIKTTITLSEQNLRYVEKMVEEGAYPSVSDVIEASIAQMMLNNTSADDPVAEMADEIRLRMELPKDRWIDWDGEEMLASIKDRWKARQSK